VAWEALLELITGPVIRSTRWALERWFYPRWALERWLCSRHSLSDSVLEVGIGAVVLIHGGLWSGGFALFLVPTDMKSPAGTATVAGLELACNMKILREKGCQSELLQGVSALDIPKDLQTSSIFIAGSPAKHDLYSMPLQGPGSTDVRKFKEQVFYSMCHHTPAKSVVVMTYSAWACGQLEFWVQPEHKGRALFVFPAFFKTYRPRSGYAHNLQELGQGVGEVAKVPDTMVAIFAPATFAEHCTFNAGKLDVAKTLRSWWHLAGDKVVTFGAFTCELEVDLVMD
jgi:hypothetical protein